MYFTRLIPEFLLARQSKLVNESWRPFQFSVNSFWQNQQGNIELFKSNLQLKDKNQLHKSIF